MSEKEERNRQQRGKHAKRRSCVELKGVWSRERPFLGVRGQEDFFSGEGFHLQVLWASHFLCVPCGPLLLLLSLGAALCLRLLPP